MKNISIIGAGASGTLLTINLIKKYKSGGLVINLIEQDNNKINKGIAYSTTELSHLLNVRASNMSIFHDDPNHFLNWLNSNGYNYTTDDFVPRKIYGNYIKDIYNEYVLNKSSEIEINIISGEVTDIQKDNDNYLIIFSNQKVLISNNVILAVGNVSVSGIEQLENIDENKYFKNPWLNDIYSHINVDDNILIIGKGLTSADVLLSLQQRNHKGKIYLISRNGLVPLKHEIISKYPSFYNELENKDINEIFSIVRKHIKKNIDSKSVIDSIRPYIQSIWKNLTNIDKSRFLRHLNRFWNVARHRIPNTSYDIIKNLYIMSKIELLTGKIISIHDDNLIKINYLNKLTKQENTIYVNKIINCIGPESNYNKLDLPLIKNLMNSGLIKNNKHNIAIEINDYNIVNKSNTIDLNFYAIGPVLRGYLFESTAIPEIKIQAEEISERILNEKNK